MLYPKNKEKELSPTLFQNPTCEYRGTPFWAWNCRMDKDMLGEQIDCLKKMGFGGFHIHPRVGMDVAYLGEEYMELVRFCTEEAKSKHMLSYLYDEDKAPSGFAGGLATKEPKYRIKHMLFTVRQMEHFPMDTAVREGKPGLLAVYDILLNENGELASYRLINENSPSHGTKWYAYLLTAPDDPWYNNQAYGDLMDPKAVDRFIQITYDAYKNAVGDEFGKTVPSIFTDEPQFMKKKPLAFANSTDDAVFPWTPSLPDGFYKKHGYDILARFPEIVWDLPNGAVSDARYHYHDYVAEALASCFLDKLGAWCAENGIALAGHMLEEPALRTQTVSSGDVMRCYRSLKIPGIDLLFDRVELTTAKQCQSAKRQYGREAMLSELYGATNWDFDFRGHKFQGDWQAALGVTVRVPHLSWVSMAGEAKRDYPASFNYQAPWYEEYRYIEDHFARVNTALTRGRPEVSVAVIHPLESYWLHFGPTDSTADIRSQLDRNFQNMTEWLLLGTIDFDFISEALLPSQFADSGEGLCVGAMAYDAVVIPGCLTLRRSTLDILEKFHSRGGRVIFAGECPKYINARPCADAQTLYKNSVRIPFDRFSMLQALEDFRIVTIREPSGERTDNLIYQMREDGGCKWLFIAAARHPTCKELTAAQEITVTVRGCFRPTLYRTLDGVTAPLPYQIRGDCTEIPFARYQSDSILLRLDPASDTASLTAHSRPQQPDKTIRFLQPVAYTRAEDNVLLLDRAEYSLNGGPYQAEEEILILDNLCRQKLGWPERSHVYPQPWTIPDVPPADFINLRFTIRSETQLTDVKLAIEDAARVQITLNGTHVPSAVTGYFTDKAIQTVALPALRKGENILTVRIPFGLRTNTEWCYLLGDFSVRLAGAAAVLYPPEARIGFSSLTHQGMPFYGGNILYHTEIETPECIAQIQASYYRGAHIKLLVDGKETGNLTFSPYSADIPLTAGKHRIEFLLYGSRINTFGGMHNLTQLGWPGPPFWRSTGSSWCYEYVLKDFGILASPVIKIFEK